MNANKKQYLVRFFSAMGAYIILVIGARWALGLSENLIIQHLVSIAPVIPVLVGAWIALVYVRTMDEVQRAVLSEAVIISFFVVGFGTFTYGFLEAYLGYSSLPIIWVLPALIVAYGLAQIVVERKYR